ncbi:MAG: cytidine deaminase [Alphaproteobacteria bacterium]|nr:cytidine deaminase [Alphaproteobacteria bacterium]
MKKYQELLKSAENALANAYAPYSQFKVGAAIRAQNGKIYQGCNVENVSYPCGTCAESGAIAAMVADGEKKIREILIVAEKKAKIMPCGACRQRIKEFADEKTVIISADVNGNFDFYRIMDLLPCAFEELE